MTDALTELLHHTPAGAAATGLDLREVRRRGRRLRRARRAVACGAAVAVVSVLGGAAVVLGHGPGDRSVQPAAPHVVRTGLTAYEKKVLHDIPRAYAVEGTVVLADRSPADQRSTNPLPGLNGIGSPRPLGFHSTVGPGYLGSTKTYRAYQDNAPKGSQVVIDAGRSYVTCIRVRGSGCAMNVLARDAGGDLYRLYGFGADDFLKPGAPMEVFLDDDWSDHQLRRTVIGGFAGTEATRVRLDLVDGSSTDATLDRGGLRPGATIFWARTPSQVTRVRAYAADGHVLESHQVRACSGGVDCEVR